MGGTFDYSWNNFTDLPPWNQNWYSSLYISMNRMTFEDIEPFCIGLPGFTYAPQQFMCEEIDTLLPLGGNYWIYSGTKGEYTNYEWYHNQQLILQGPGLDTLFLENISYADTGIYYCDATNSLVNGLLLRRNNVFIGIDTGASINNSQVQNQYTIYPNPASEKITVLFPFKSEPVSLRIFNMEGKCVFKREQIPVNNSKITVGIKGLKSGIYLLRIQTENRNYSTKLIINKRGTKQ